MKLDEAVFVGGDVFQVPSLFRGEVAEEAEAIAEKNRREGQSDFIDEAEFEGLLREQRSADEPDVSEARCEFCVQKIFELAGVKFDAGSCPLELSPGQDNAGSVAVGPAQLKRVLVGAGAHQVAVDAFDEGGDFFFGDGDAGLVDAFAFVEPGDGVVSSRDESIEAGDHVQRDI